MNNNLDIDKIKKIAFDSHKNQRYGEHDYSYHLESVVQLAYHFNFDLDTIAACYLHDMIEDCGVSKQFIESISNKNVAEMVWAVSGEGKNRKEKKQNMLIKIKNYPLAINLKMLDRLANMLECTKNAPDKLTMYINELPDYMPLFKQGNSKLYAEFQQFMTKPTSHLKFH
jgi:(p)ppGpp synthase/HD superfamily hydrolase